MRVALDAEPLTLTSGGLKRYVEELTTALRASYPEDEYIYLPQPRTFLRRRWWLYGAERASAHAHIDVFHGTNFAIPFFSHRPRVLTLHDLSPWRNPQWHRGQAAARIRRRTPYLLPLASHVITPSEAVRREAIARFHLAPERVTAIPLAASPHFRPTPRESDPYLLFVGTLEPRKGIATLLEAWRAGGRKIPLRLVGRTREDFPPLSPEPNLHLLGEVPDSSLPALYTNATAVVYPSEYEGFGLPVLEAMQCAANVITSCDPALLELTGDTAQHFSTPAELAQLCVAPANRPELRGAAQTRSANYSWQKTAHLTREIYVKLLGNRSKPQ